jgi:hypothetical protein
MWSSEETDFSGRVPPRDLPELMDASAAMRSFVAACAVWSNLTAGYWAIGRRWPGWLGCRVGCVIRCTFLMWEVAAAICCGGLQPGLTGAAFLCS